MALPEPVPGLVIRYSYLWRSEAQQGREEGLKDRPCAIVLAVKPSEQDAPRVMVAPITHTPPEDPKDAIEIPQKIGQAIGLDHAKSWIVTREVNTFTWPGPDIRSAGKDRTAFGRLPHGIADRVRQNILERAKTRSLQSVERDEEKPIERLERIRQTIKRREHIRGDKNRER